jgi:drug/metabolite transporter (DMT)-like permease
MPTRSAREHKKLLAGVAILAATLLWAWSFTYAKPLFEVVHPIFLVGIDFTLSGLVFLTFCLATGRKLSFRFREGLILALLCGFYELAQNTGLSQTTAANTAFISGLGMLFIPLYQRIFFKKAVSRVIWWALGLSLVGLYFLTGGIDGIHRGDLWVMLCALGMGWYFVETDRFEKKRRSDVFVLCTQQFLLVGLFSLALAFLLGEANVSAFATHGGEFFVLSFFTTLLPYFFVQWSQGILTYVQVTFINTLEPFFGGVIAWTIGSEKFTGLMLAGGILMTGACIIAEMASLARHRPPMGKLSLVLRPAAYAAVIAGTYFAAARFYWLY